MADRLSLTLWAATVATFGVGDSLTTIYGLGLAGVSEGNAYAATILSAAGIPGLLVTKVAILALAFASSRVVPPRYRFAFPLGLTALGTFVTIWNLSIITTMA